MGGLEVKDIAGLSGPIKKLIEVCAEGIGAVARPWLIKRDAMALAAAQNALEQAGLDIGSANIPSIDAQISARIEYREAKRHRNLYQVVSAAKEALPESVSEEGVDGDWIGRFFSYAQDVSNAEMQQIWGRLLSGEVERPGTFSMRTLEVVRSLSINEAKAFHKLSRYILHDSFFLSPHPLIGKFGRSASEYEIYSEEDRWSEFYKSQGISPDDFKLLEEIGLLNSSFDSRSYTWQANDACTPIILAAKSNEGIAVINNSATNQPWSVTVAGQDLTHIGQQLVRIMQPPRFPRELLIQLDTAAQRHGLSCKFTKIRTNPDTGEFEFELTESGSGDE